MFNFAPNPDMMKHFHDLRNSSKLLLFPLFSLFVERKLVELGDLKGIDVMKVGREY